MFEQLLRTQCDVVSAARLQDAQGFAAYQKQYSNTICGQYPIAVLLKALELNNRQRKHELRFVRYAQSSKRVLGLRESAATLKQPKLRRLCGASLSASSGSAGYELRVEGS